MCTLYCNEREVMFYTYEMCLVGTSQIHYMLLNIKIALERTNVCATYMA